MCCKLQCNTALMEAIKVVFSCRRAIVGGYEIPEGLPYPQDETFCLHAPGFLGSTPVVRLFAKCVTCAAKIAPTIDMNSIRRRPNLGDFIIPKGATRFFLDAMAHYTFILQTSNPSVVPHLLNTEPDFLPSLLDFITLQLVRHDPEGPFSEVVTHLALSLLHGICTMPAPTMFSSCLATVYAAVRANSGLMHLMTNPSLVPETHSHQWRKVTRCLVDAMESVDSLITRAVRQNCGNYDCNAWADIGESSKPGATKLFWCVRSKRIKYCSKECQKADWKWHKMFCCADTMPMPENVGLGTKWASDSGLWAGAPSNKAARGVDLAGLDKLIEEYSELN
ncbi:hypothetical protein HDU93_003469 [Gonapodya sp. JEL0774]|nr:hypothetical protein HDU93_003469 [Gonapodya sp. JEL0774]